MTGVDPRPTPLALTWALVVGALSQALFVWPLHMTMAAGQNAVLALPLMIGWILLVVWLHGHGRRGGSWSRSLWHWMDLIGLIVVVGLDALTVSLFISMLRVVFFVSTPRWALALPLIGVVVWLGAQGLEAAARLMTLWMPLLALATVLVLGLGLTNVAYAGAILPNSTIVIPPVLHALTIGAYLGMPWGVTIRRWMPHVQGAGHAPRLLTAVLITWGFLSGLYLLTLATLGPDALTHLRWPLMFTFEQVTLDSAFFLSRVGIAVIFLWTGAMVLGTLVHLTAVGDWVNLPPRGSGTAILVTLVGGGIGAAGVFIGSPTIATRWLLHVADPICGIYLVAELALLVGAGRPAMAPQPASPATQHDRPPARSHPRPSTGHG